jgi:uncharacterized protein YbjT (DUF2867 family)
MTKTSLIIGGTGFLGAGIVDALRQAGWAVTNLARGQMPSQAAEAPLIKADRSQNGAIAAAIAGKTFDLVVDCAAYVKRDAEDVVDALAGKVGISFSSARISSMRPTRRRGIRWRRGRPSNARCLIRRGSWIAKRCSAGRSPSGRFR